MAKGFGQELIVIFLKNGVFYFPLPTQSHDGGLSRKTSAFDIESSSKRHEAFNVGV
jgi:hypothetical protein